MASVWRSTQWPPKMGPEKGRVDPSKACRNPCLFDIGKLPFFARDSKGEGSPLGVGPQSHFAGPKILGADLLGH